MRFLRLPEKGTSPSRRVRAARDRLSVAPAAGADVPALPSLRPADFALSAPVPVRAERRPPTLPPGEMKQPTDKKRHDSRTSPDSTVKRWKEQGEESRSDSQWCRLDDDSRRTGRGARRQNPNLRARNGKRRWELYRHGCRVQNSDIRRSRRDRRGLLVAERSSTIGQGRSVIRRTLFMAALIARGLGPMMLMEHARHLTNRADDQRAQQCHEQNGCGAAHTHQSTTLRSRSAFPFTETEQNVMARRLGGPRRFTLELLRVEDASGPRKG